MKSLLPLYKVLCLGLLAASVCSAQAQPTSTAKPLNKEAQQDIARHRVISAAHEAAAKCLEAGKNDEVCEKDLQLACKGVAIGKYCGMKHEH